MTNPTSNFGWQMPTPTDLVTDLPADFEVFGQAVDTSMADLRGGTTGQILSKTTNTDMDFTWITNDVGDITAVNVTSPITGGGSSGAVTIGINAATTSVVGAVQLSDSTSTTSSVLASTPTATKAAYDLANTASTTATAAIPKSTVTTAGDVIYATGSAALTRLGIGTAGQVLKVNSGATAPEWGAAASASGMTLVTSQTFSAAAAQSVNSCFTSTYTNYRLIITLSGVSADGDVRLFMRAAGTDNANSNNGNSWYGINANGTAVSANENGSVSWGLFQTDSASNASRYFCVLDLANPQVTSDTSGTWNSQYIVAATSAIAFNVGGGLNYNATSYDGFTLKASAGNMTGKVWVYGYSNV